MGLPDLDLTLPAREPALLKDWEHSTYEDGSIAVYTTVPNMEPAELDAICKIPQEEWENIEMETQLARPAQPTPFFAGHTLKDIVAAHIAMDKEIPPPSKDSDTLCPHWLPYVFVVVTKPMQDLEDHGLLLVYADPDATENDQEEAAMDKFFFAPKEMYMLLSGIPLGQNALFIDKEEYDIDGERWKEKQEEENTEDKEENKSEVADE